MAALRMYCDNKSTQFWQDGHIGECLGESIFLSAPTLLYFLALLPCVASFSSATRSSKASSSPSSKDPVKRTRPQWRCVECGLCALQVMFSLCLFSKPIFDLLLHDRSLSPYLMMSRGLVMAGWVASTQYFFPPKYPLSASINTRRRQICFYVSVVWVIVTLVGATLDFHRLLSNLINEGWSHADDNFYTGEIVCHFIVYGTHLVIVGSLLSRFLVLRCTGSCSARQPYSLVDPTAESTPSPSSVHMPHICPEDEASTLSRMLFWWMNGLLKYGRSKPLTHDDLWTVPEKDSADIHTERFKTVWAGYTGLPESRYPLVRAISKVYLPPFSIACFTGIFAAICAFASPVFLKKIVEFVQDTDSTVMWGYVWMGCMIVSRILETISNHQKNWVATRIGMHIRTALSACVFGKSLNLNSTSSHTYSNGEIVNLMQVDVDRIASLLSLLVDGIVLPLQIALALVLLSQIIGLSLLAAVAVMLAMLVVNGILSKFLQKCQTKVMKAKDERMRITSEVLNAIKIIKLYAWEDKFTDRIKASRDAEVHDLSRGLYAAAVNIFLLWLTPVLVSVLTFSMYAWLGNRLDAAVVFPAMTTMQLLQEPIRSFPFVIVGFVQAFVSIRRVQKYLLCPELDADAVIRESSNEPTRTDDNCSRHGSINGPLDLLRTRSDGNRSHLSSSISSSFVSQRESFAARPREGSAFRTVLPNRLSIQVSNGSFGWTAKSNATLEGIDISIASKELVAVVGSVGSGKSSLLSALIGDMLKLNGAVHIRGSLSYSTQQAWIQNTTVKENILFGLPYEEESYHTTIQVCALEQDLKILPGGDMTEIGERGINLSGGQKARVSIARAVYANRDIILLDDPLSAVDAHVGAHIFHHCIRGFLKDKTRILVTHALHFLPFVDKIIVMDGGKCVQFGTFDDLAGQQDGMLAKMLTVHGHNDTTQSKAAEDHIDSTEADQVSHELAPAVPSVSNQTVDDLMTVEEKQVGSVGIDVYAIYAKHAGGGSIVLTIFAGMFVWQFLRVLSDLWLSRWSNPATTDTEENSSYYVSVYAILGCCSAAFILVRTTLISYGGLRACKLLHDRMIKCLIAAPMNTFYDVTPLGRILNRLSKDVMTVDQDLHFMFGSLLAMAFQLLGVVLVCTFTTPPILIGLPILTWIALKIQSFFLATSRELTRLDSISRSPIVHHFSESLSGASVIRAFQVQNRFTQRNRVLLDRNNSAYFPLSASNEWLGVQLELAGLLLLVVIGMFAIANRNTIDPGLMALSLSYCIALQETLFWMVKCTVTMENKMISVERATEYTKLPAEEKFITNANRGKAVSHDQLDRTSNGSLLPFAQLNGLDQDSPIVPASDWPSLGSIQFDSYTMRYRPTTAIVLNSVSCVIRPEEKVGIVGRTGAGKSSLCLALFRLVEAESGRILIDGLDIAQLTLQALRSRICVIPQDPVLFSGTLRFNLDPFGEYRDEKLYEIIRQVYLMDTVQRSGNGLEMNLSENGENLSVGERQLVCIGRALLRKSKVLVMDEATASVDSQTDSLIQQTIRTGFASCTVLTIAHRLHTVIDNDRVMVLDRGRIAELDTPATLLANPQSMFAGLVRESKGHTNVK